MQSEPVATCGQATILQLPLSRRRALHNPPAAANGRLARSCDTHAPSYINTYRTLLDPGNGQTSPSVRKNALRYVLDIT